MTVQEILEINRNINTKSIAKKYKKSSSKSMKILFTAFFLFCTYTQLLIAQNITSQELSKLSGEINTVQVAANGKNLIDPDDKSSVVITFPRESFTVFFSSGFASQAVYKDGGTDQLFVTENIDFSLADKVTVMPVNNKSGVQCIRVTFRETVVTRVMENGKEVSTNNPKLLDFYCAADNAESKNKLKTSLETLISQLSKFRAEYKERRLGKWVTEPVAFFSSIGAFKDGLAKVSKGPGGFDDKWGYINTDGKIVVPLKYEEAKDFSNGFACVTISNKNGFVNRNGKLVVPLIYDFASSFSEGLAVVGKKGLFGCIDTTGKIVVPIKYDFIHDFHEGIASFKDTKGKSGFIDKAGKSIIDLVDIYACYGCGEFKNGLMLMAISNPKTKHGFLTKDGKEAISFIYDEARPFSEGLACVAINKKYGYINKEGKIVVPLEYDFAYSFENGLATVKLQESYGVNERYGIIDKNGNIVAPLRYKFIYSFSEGVAGITRDGKKGFINESGKEIIPPKYDEAHGAKNGLIAVSLGGSWGYIDLEGNTQISFVFEKAEDFVGGLAEVVYAGKARIIDKSGKYWTGPKK